MIIGPLTLCVILDVDLSSTQTTQELEPFRLAATSRSLPCILVIDEGLNGEKLNTIMQRARTFGVFNYITRPFDADDVLRTIPLMGASASDREAIAQSRMPLIGIMAAHSMLSRILEAPGSNRTFSFEDVKAIDNLVLDALSAWGIRPWIETVRRHHSDTYRHSLLVTGFAVAFSQKLRMRKEDQQRIARAALLHDIGKALVPLSILDKPDKLTPLEVEEIRKHPRYGYDLLVEQGGFPAEILDCVLHHHELLDGSGYPDGLRAPQITDLVRIITITDIFSALIENRAYRKSLTPPAALGIMRDMGNKLDTDLLHAFQAVVEDASNANKK